MTPADLSTFEPRDTLFLWWLGDPASPRLIGELRTFRAMRGVSLRYSTDWLNSGFAISENCPLMDLEFIPEDAETAVGAVDDARPDRWGERVINALDKPLRRSVMEYLFYAGDDRFGALGVSLSDAEYVPRTLGPLPGMADVASIQAMVESVLSGRAVPDAKRRLIVPSVTMGGARPKALVDIEGAQWIVKFSEHGEDVDVPLVEHATMTLTKKAGISSAETRAIPLARGHAVAVKRFDRIGDARLHALSANTALKAAGVRVPGYPELAQLLRRRGVVKNRLFRKDMAELFDRMVFNILIDNTDDHEKNHVLLQSDAAEYELSPAFDVLPTGQALGYQAMRVGKKNQDSTIENAFSEHAQFGLSADDAALSIRRVAGIVDGWRDHFAAAGVGEQDIENLARQIDRPFLLDQRIAVR